MMIHKQRKQENPKKNAPGSLDARMLAYCAVAGGALLATHPAEAAVVYSGVKNISLADNQTVGVDLDGNGAIDFTFFNFADQSTFSTQKRVLVPKTMPGSSTFKTYRYTNLRSFQSNIINLGLTPQNAIAQKAPAGSPLDPSKVLLKKGEAVPGEGINWVAGQDISIPLSHLARTSVFTSFWVPSAGNPDPPVPVNKLYNLGGAFQNKTGFLGVRFEIGDNTHYGWVQYKGDNGSDDNSADNSTTPTFLNGTIIDWAYEDTSFQPIYIDAEQPAPPCTVALTPGRISKLASLVMPVTGIIIRGNESAAFTRKSEINWGSDTVKTLFKIRLSKKTILALVRVKPLLLQGEDTYEVTVDDCSGELKVAPF